MLPIPRDNSQLARRGESELTRHELQFQVFPARILSVDWERKNVTLEDQRTGTTYVEIGFIPAVGSSHDTTEVWMPEQGASCMAVPIWYRGGFQQVALLNYTLQDTNIALDAIATRGPEGVEGLSNRKRANYRKAFPGQKTTVTSGGFTEKIDSDWDRAGKDLSRDHLDAERRTWTQITGRRVQYSEAGLSFQGPVNRPNAATVVPRTLPDGTQEWVVFLQPNTSAKDRYVSGTADVLPFVENTTRIQEFGLDYPVPQEILETDLLDFVLGTTQDPWERTSVSANTNGLENDDETVAISQSWDHPYSLQPGVKAVGPTTQEGATPRRRGFILEKSEGTLVGYNRFDTDTYGKVLKPSLFVSSEVGAGRFGSDVSSSYTAVADSANHAEARLAASALSVRFPHEYNTTRWDVTKEGLITFEVGSTIPKENINWPDGYENPHGAGRSMEGHLVGSLKLVIGKNRDEEESIDLVALGQTVIRLGADDTLLPDDRRSVFTQIRGQKDAPGKRSLQYWKKSAYGLKEAGDLAAKTGFENVSLRMAADGALIARIGARIPGALRKHLINGYSDGQGFKPYEIGSKDRKDSHTAGRPTYASGDSNYAFVHPYQVTLATAGKPLGNPDGTSPSPARPPFNIDAWSGNPIPAGADAYGLSVDFHTVRDVLLRLGANPDNNQSLLMDLAGGIVAAIGADKQGRSLTATLDGGVQMRIGKNKLKKGLQLEIVGDIDITHFGNLHWQSTGEWVTECTAWRHISKTDTIFTQQKAISSSLTRDTVIAPDIVNDQGTQVPAPGDENS